MLRAKLPLLALALSSLMTPVVVNAGAPDPSQEARQLIDELGLSAADNPVSGEKGWRPQRVVISLPQWMSDRAPDLEQQLREVAGEASLHIVRDPRFAVTEEDLAGADAFMSFCNPASVMKADSSLRWFHNYFVGMDRCAGLPDEVLDRVVFSNNKRLSGPTIAEHTVAMMLSLARGLPAYSRAQAENRWDRSVADRPPFGELKGKTLFVVGLGGIGTEVAWRGHGLGMNVIALRHSSREGPDYIDYVGLSPELHELAARADVIVNALPLTRQTTGLFDQAFFAAAKPGAMFLSVGRGKSTVTDDLVESLKSGRLYGAGLDVTDPEPLPADSPLWQLPNVIITPHTSASGGDSYRRTAIIAVENLRRYIAGEPLLNVVNMRAGY